MNIRNLIIAVLAAASLAQAALPFPDVPLPASASALASPLKAWDARVQKELDTMMSKGEEHTLAILSQNGMWDILRDSKELHQLEAQMEPLYGRFMGEANYHEDQLGEDDRALLAALGAHGLVLKVTEGMPFLMLDNNSLYDRIPWFPRSKSLVGVLKQQPARLVVSGGLCLSVEEMGRLALMWDELVNEHEELETFHVSIAREHYRKLLHLMLWCDMPNTPAFPRHGGSRMPEAWRASLQKVAASAPGSDTAGLINAYLKRLKANGWKLNKDIRRKTEHQLMLLPKGI